MTYLSVPRGSGKVFGVPRNAAATSPKSCDCTTVTAVWGQVDFRTALVKKASIPAVTTMTQYNTTGAKPYRNSVNMASPGRFRHPLLPRPCLGLVAFDAELSV